LLSNGRIENPLAVLKQKLGKAGRIAVQSTELVAILVFHSGVEDIDWETDTGEPIIVRCNEVL
jgi:hypothetical protein